MIGGAMILHRLVTGGNVHPADTRLPLYKQRVRVGGWHKSWTERWGTWVGLFFTFSPLWAVLIYVGLEAIGWAKPPWR